MTQNIRSIFEHNIRLLGDMDKAVYYFRRQQCDQALVLLAGSIDEIKLIIEAIVTDREYFNLVDTKSMIEMFSGTIEAMKNGDYILLADLLELQLINFLIGVQELIISKEELDFDEDNYNENMQLLLERGEGFSEELTEPINAAQLLDRGYRVEFSSCGRMTLAAENEGSKFYFHTNSKIQFEAFLLAKQWYSKNASTYIVYGFGMGYHLSELRSLAPEAAIEVYETDTNVVRLACAFADVKNLLGDDKVRILYDPEFEYLKKRIASLKKNEVFVIHNPSYRNIRNPKGRTILEREGSLDRSVFLT